MTFLGWLIAINYLHIKSMPPTNLLSNITEKRKIIIPVILSIWKYIHMFFDAQLKLEKVK